MRHIDKFDRVVQKIPNCFFVEIGANDGIDSDPIHSYVIENNWSGILVEPDPKIFAKLQQTYLGRENLIFEQCAISDVTGHVDLYTGIMDNTSVQSSGMHNTLVKSRGECYFTINPEVISVPSITTSALLEKHNVTKVDVLLIDTEGYDFVILKLFPFDRFRPTAIICEYVNLHLMNQTPDEMKSFLEDLGYVTFLDGPGGWGDLYAFEPFLITGEI